LSLKGFGGGTSGGASGEDAAAEESWKADGPANVLTEFRPQFRFVALYGLTASQRLDQVARQETWSQTT
jgi:hypothetical protein